MKLIAMLLLLTGWLIVLCAIVLFPSPSTRNLFIFSGVLVEAIGLVLAFRRAAL
jgi:hypothetical protein